MPPNQRLVQTLTATAFVTGLGIVSGTAGAAPGTPPSSGQILQQNAPQQKTPAPPKSAIQLPGPARQQGNANQKIHVQHIHITGNQLLPTPTLRPAVAGLTGQTVTLGKLRAAAHHITRIYHHHELWSRVVYTDLIKRRSGCRWTRLSARCHR